MPPLDPDTDFRDDGGTRAWRNDQATFSATFTMEAPVIDAPQRGLRAWWRHTSIWKILWLAFLVCFICPWVFFIVALLAGFATDQALGH